MKNEAFFFLYPLLAGGLVCLATAALDRSRFAVRGVVGPYFAALALLFGLFSSLTAGDVWQRLGRANTLVATEVNALRSLLRLGEALGPAAASVATEVKAYAEEVERAEFQAPTDSGHQPLPSMRALYQLAVSPAIFGGNHVVQAQFLASLETVRSAHLERLELRQAHLAPMKLLLVFLFGVLTQIAIALCHAGNPRASATAVMLFSVAFAACAGFLTVYDDPAAFSRLVSDRVLADVK